MKRVLLITAIALPTILWAQQDKSDKKEVERIIITKKGNDAGKMNIVVDGENITVNGKPLDNDGEGDITVKRLKIKDPNTFSWSPEAGFGDESGDMDRRIRVFRAPNKAMLGVTTEKTEEGVKVMSVNDETGAKKAGLKEGDIITKVDDKTIETPDQLSESLKDKKPGDKVTIAYKRDGKAATVTAELTKWNAPQVMAFNGNGSMNFSAPDINFEELMARIPRNFDSGNWNNRNGNVRIYGAPALGIHRTGPKLGIKVQDVEKSTGVKIIELEKGSDADKAGLKEGDIIKEANEAAVDGTDDLLAQTRESRAGSTLKLKVERNGKTQHIDVLFSKKIKTADL